MTQTTTQSFIPVKEIRDGVIVREDGVLCAILLVSSINFDLKSDDEKKAILYQFQNMLNSLEVSIQILIQSRKLNIQSYIEYLQEMYTKQTSELLQLQTREYIKFIQNFTEKRKIIFKKFFIVVPYTPIPNAIKGLSNIFFNKQKVTKGDKSLEENFFQLNQRVSYVQNNIRSSGLRTVKLGTEEIIELLHKTFNPGDAQTFATAQV